jgi:UDP-3-O-[3-hydroxymyristoyl] N-acetylglucosamine deacetylase/3-hydroxyacyl-[acyl-carrier-protein] dehydratase
MLNSKQRTIKEAISLSGVGLHTGNTVNVTLKPLPENSGILFKRIDLPGSAPIKPTVDNIIAESKVLRCTTIKNGDVQIYTVEHLMSALAGLGIDNLLVEMDNTELPGLDGSGIEFLQALKKSGIVDQNAEKEYIDIQEPICVNNNGSSILIVPDQELKISYSLSYRHPYLGSQFFSTVVNSETYEKEIAPCRTFCLEEETRELRLSGLGKGANNHNTLVVGQHGVIDNEVRFPDEFARHKVLDVIGDLYLLGKPIRGNIFAVKSGHSLNIALLKKIYQKQEVYKKRNFTPAYHLGEHKELDVHQIMQIIPHRYPFLFVDRIIELEKGKRAVGIKNVTINDQFFNGHFPTRPVMPGVLMVEALAQVGGIILLTSGHHHGKLALFMAADNVKFRKLVLPGDQLILEVDLVRDRGKTALLHGKARVGEEIVAEADILVAFTDANFLD